jgi:hypothetical protein
MCWLVAPTAHTIGHCQGENIRGPFEKFVDPPYYSESKLCGGAVTVSFSKYRPWQVRHFSKTCCRPLITSKFLACLGAPFSWLEKPRNRMGRVLNWILGKSESVEPHQNARHTVQISPHAISGLFQPRKGSSEARHFEVTVCSTFSVSRRSVVRSAALAKGGTSKKRPKPHLHKVPTRSNKASPRTFQTALVYVLGSLSS